MNDAPDHRIAQAILTPAEHDAYQLNQRGLSQRTIALHLGISRSAVRARLENARRKLHAARKDNAA